MLETTKQICDLIDQLPFEDYTLKETLKDFSKSALETVRGLQKDTGMREVAEVIFWLSNEYIKHRSLVHLMDDFYEFSETFAFTPALLVPELDELWSSTQKDDSMIFLQKTVQSKQTEKMRESGFFPYGVTRAQTYFVEGVLENMYAE